jgi:hypothetical protein
MGEMAMDYAQQRHEREKDGKPCEPAVLIKSPLTEAGWWAIPMEWNMAKNLADRCGNSIKMVDSQGVAVREYHPVSS